MAKRAEAVVFKRNEPDLPPEMEAEEDAVAAFEAEDIEIRERWLTNTRVDERTFASLRVKECILERVSLANCRFGSVTFKDVRLIECDLANLKAHGMTMVRVTFERCRMTGLQAGIAELQDVLIAEGDQRYMQFRFSKCQSSEFDHCNLEEADFHGTDLSGSRFRVCNLKKADLGEVKLAGADLRGSQLEGVLWNAEDIRGATIDPVQALEVARLLGVKIV